MKNTDLNSPRRFVGLDVIKLERMLGLLDLIFQRYSSVSWSISCKSKMG
ncbi:hypothetical protein AXX17_AT1G49510 [Arabidopsis thaliana]|uniref:Uncharacterized protein n=1 Tax=Arabidopsis thaliana TaxID=3702 RepID=A0A178WIS7_ARATH|nr:hypothetical protein AXX17_AT1G49510 [Arabidopsis thaliana]